MTDKKEIDATSYASEQREVFTIVEEQPSYQGGLDALYRSITSEVRYPLTARLDGIEGRVDVQFVIERDGSLLDIKTVSGIGGGCDQEAIRVVEAVESFVPGAQRGRTVRTRMQLPITFDINRDKTNPDNSPMGTVIVGELVMKNEKLKVDAKYDEGIWSGTIYSIEGDGLPGTNISVAGTQYGTVSDLDGTFSVAATSDQDLVISFVGYESERLMAPASE